MAYLEPSEYVAYGLGADTADAWVLAASAMVDAHCRRSSLNITSYTERLRVSRPWGTVQLNYGPAVQVTALKARYAPQMERGENTLAEYALLFGLPGQWVTMDPTTAMLDTTSGEVQLPANLLGMRYSEAEVTYTAGLAAIPDGVKVACAQIVKNAQATPGLNVKSSKLDTLQTQYFSDSLLDAQVQAMLRPFVAERMG
ncbi:MAG: hypothetical protein ACRYFU_14850 [Janthinobacterium lividum]